MQIAKPAEYKKVRMKFIVTAVVSLMLLVIVVSCALLNVRNFQTEKADTKTISRDAIEYVQANTVLQHKLQDLDNAIALSRRKNKNTEGQLKAKIALQLSLDSLQTAVASMNDHEQKADINNLLLFFRNTLQTHVQLENEYASLRTQMEKLTVLTDNNQNASKDDELKAELQQREVQIETLKEQDERKLAEKNNQIASLTIQLQQATNRPKQEKDDEAAAWKQKFKTLEARFKELDGEYNALSQAYQNAVSNNRKLLSQLQAGKKS